MHVLTLEQAQQIEGGGFWHGFICGLTGVAAIAALISPEPVSKFGLFSLASGWAACFG